jgi:hypothetical protein
VYSWRHCCRLKQFAISRSFLGAYIGVSATILFPRTNVKYTVWIYQRFVIRNGLAKYFILISNSCTIFRNKSSRKIFWTHARIQVFHSLITRNLIPNVLSHIKDTPCICISSLSLLIVSVILWRDTEQWDIGGAYDTRGEKGNTYSVHLEEISVDGRIYRFYIHWMNWRGLIHMADDREKWTAVVNTVMKLEVP